MSKRPLIWETIALLVMVGVLNYVATVYHLYWSIYEFDSFVHLLAGAAVSAFFLWLYFFSGYFKPSQRSLVKFFIISILGTMILALMWEIYELALGEVVMQKTEYPHDTMMDFVMDFLGAIAMCFYAFIKELKKGIPPYAKP